MTETEQALFCCLTALTVALAKDGALDPASYLTRLAAAGAGAAEGGSTEFAEALHAHIRQVGEMLHLSGSLPTQTAQ